MAQKLRQTDRGVARVVIGPSIGYVPLTRGNFALVDADDVPLLQRYNWATQKSAKAPCYAHTTIYKGPKQPSWVRMHRFLLGVSEPTTLVDHRNGNTLDNRRTNIRAATNSQNGMNSKVRKTNLSGLKGAYRSVTPAGTVRFTSSVMVNGTTHHLGSFRTAEAAHEAYLARAKELQGEFFRTT